MIAGSGPMPWPISENSGIIRPNSAMEGMVSTTVAAPCSGPASHLKRVISTPSGTPTRMARPTAMATSSRCCSVSWPTWTQSRREITVMKSMSVLLLCGLVLFRLSLIAQQIVLAQELLRHALHRLLLDIDLGVERLHGLVVE